MAPPRIRWLIFTALGAIGWTLQAETAPIPDWIPFQPGRDDLSPAELDLRFLNETNAGDEGPIAARGAEFVHSVSGRPIRFWGVNGVGSEGGDAAAVRRAARTLAKRGVNLVRLHGAVFNAAGEPDPKRIETLRANIAALKAEGIYSLCSIYFPLWLKPPPETAWLKGYNGNQHPFAALLFNPEFQAQYRRWWTNLLTTPDAHGARLIDDPAIMGLELQNEDSFFFWTFSEQNLPEPQRRLLEEQFGAWATDRFGSIEKALARWDKVSTVRDVPAERRLGFRPLWNLSHERTLRDQDTAAFLVETQTGFYRRTSGWLKSLGFKGVITASNWTTAENRVLGPLEKQSYTVGDFLDRHGYFSCNHRGDQAEWSLRPGHTYQDRSALRFDPEAIGKPRSFVHPIMEVTYDDKPSMISETTWNRPNRFRSEAPLFLAIYGALQGTDAIAHFAFDGADWQVKPGYWMQPWTLSAPSQLGQFPAAALIFRRGLIHPGEVLAQVALGSEDLRALRGTPLPQDAAFDELRAKDLPAGADLRPDQVLDPLLHFAGRAEVRFTNGPSQRRVTNLTPYVDRTSQTVRSTTGEVRLDYGRGFLVFESAGAQGISGHLRGAGRVVLGQITVESGLDLGHIALVSLTEEPLAASKRLLLQVMTEERPTGWRTESTAGGMLQIADLGRDPWQIRAIQGQVEFRTHGTETIFITPLDPNGRAAAPARPGSHLTLEPGTLYYLITRK